MIDKRMGFETLTEVKATKARLNEIIGGVKARRLLAMRRKSYNDPHHCHFLTFSCYRRQQLLTDDRLRLWFTQALADARDAEGFDLWAYVIMPEHVHLVIHPRNEDYSIGQILRRIKAPFTIRTVKYWKDHYPRKLALIQASTGKRMFHRFWQDGGGFDRNLTDIEIVARAIEYVEYNPVRRGLVNEPTDWRWSSARARAGMKDVVLRIDALDFDVQHQTNGL